MLGKWYIFGGKEVLITLKMKVMKKFSCVVFAVMMLVCAGCGAKKNDTVVRPKETLEETIRKTRQEMSDSVLIRRVVELCWDDFKEMDRKKFSILYNYVTSCKDEDAAEGIYDGITRNLVYNPVFTQDVFSFLDSVKPEERSCFLSKFPRDIIWLQFIYCNECMDFDDVPADSMANYIIENLPPVVFKEIYNSDTATIEMLVEDIRL